MTSLSLLHKRLVALDLSRVASEIEGLARAAIRLHTKRVEEASIPLGASKIGGLPDLATGLDWPWWGDLPFDFVAQLNLADVAGLDVEHVLPSKGLLSFFWTDKRWNAQEQKVSWVYGSNDAVQGRVLYQPPGAKRLERHALPANPGFDTGWNACAVTCLPHLTLPTAESKVITALNLSQDEREHYYAIVREMHALHSNDRHDHPSHWLLGYPEPIQNDDMAMECQFYSHGLSYEDMYPEFYNRSLVPNPDLLSGIADWRLLLQMGEDDNAGMEWNDSGCIYYWIRKQDLGAQVFDKVQLLEQSC